MKKVVSIIISFGFLMVSFSGCNSENKKSSVKLNENDSSVSFKYSEDEYILAKNVFVDQYKLNIDKMQQIISGFNFSEEHWAKYKNQKDELNKICVAFFNDESKLSDKNLENFNNLKKLVDMYSTEINKLEESREKGADEQAAIIAEIVKNMNKINLVWKEKTEVKS